MNSCSLKDIKEFDSKKYLAAVRGERIEEFLSEFTSEARQHIEKALYSKDGQPKEHYRNGWLYTKTVGDAIQNYTVNSDSIIDESTKEDMDANSPNKSFNRKSAAEVSRKLNEIFKIDEERIFNRTFEKEFLKRCIYDIDTRTAVDSTQLNQKIYEWKSELWENIRQELKIESVSWIENPSSSELTELINHILMLAEASLDGIKLTDSLKENLYFLSKMDSLLEETGCIDRDDTLKPFEHSRTMYSFSQGRVRMYTNWSKDEEAGIEENSSPLMEFLLQTIPCVDEHGNNVDGLYLEKAINNFSSLFIQEFVLKHPNSSLRLAVLTGQYSEGLFRFLESGQDRRMYEKRYEKRTRLSEEDRILVINHMLDLAYGELLTGIYGDTPEGARVRKKYKDVIHGTFQKRKSEYSYRTDLKILEGLKKHVFTSDNKGIPLVFKKLIINQMYKTVQNVYLSTSLNRDGDADITLLHDKHIKSQSSELTNSLVGRIKYFRRNPKVYKQALEKAGITFIDENEFEISIPDGSDIRVSITLSENNDSSTTFRFKTDTKDEFGLATEGLMNVLKTLMGSYCGLPNIYKFENGVKVVNEDRLKMIHDNSSISFLNTVLPVIGTILVGSDPSYKMPTSQDDSNTVNLSKQYALNEPFALLQYSLNGYDNNNVVKSIEGTNLPNYGLRSSIYDYQLFIDKANEDLRSNYRSVFMGNPLLGHENALKAIHVTVNNGVDLNGQTKLVSQMSAEEHAIQGIFINFLRGAINKNPVAYHYTTVDSDKSRQFYIGFDLESLKIGNTSLASLLNDVMTSDKRADAIVILTDYISAWQKQRSENAIFDILNSYARVYDKLAWETESDGTIKVSEANIKLINNHLKNKVKTVRQLRSDFRNKGIILWEEYHFTVPKGGALQLNESYLYEYDIHKTPDSTRAWYEAIQRQLAVDITKNGEYIWYTDFNVKVDEEWVNNKQQVIFAKIYDKKTNEEIDFGHKAEQYLFNADGSINPDYIVKLNPIIEACFYSDIICSNSFNDIYYGFSENQDNKSKGTPAEKLASRISSGYKRTVHAGSPGHHLAIGWNRTVSSHLTAACVEDERLVHSTNVIGESTDVEPRDGGTDRLMVAYFIERWSLGDAAIGYGSSKTIWNDNQQGKSMLWKHASFDISNEVRRASGMAGTNSAEDLTRKGLELFDHTEILKLVNFSKYFGETGEYKGNLYTYNPFTKRYYIIESVTNNQDGSVTIRKVAARKNGNVGTKVIETKHQLNSLYDIDQILGGAYTMVLTDSGLEFSDIQSEILAKIICDLGLQEDFIAYFLPKSAMKSGRCNMNEAEVWKTDYKRNVDERFGDVWTFRISTAHGRLMMNAEHDIDGSISETTQMIASLCQKGYTKEEANLVYSIIGQIVEKSKKTYYEGLDTSDANIRKKLEKFVISALESTKGTSTGISDSDALASFCRKNQIALPLSAPAVLSKLAPAINAELTKEFIRRSYPGVAAVNAPSYNMIETYKFNDRLYDYTSVCSLIYDDIKANHLAKYAPYAETLRKNAGWNVIDENDTVEHLVRNVWKYIDIVNGENKSTINNPYIIQVNSNTEINQGDTIVYRRKGEVDEYDNPVAFTIKRLNSYIDSDEWRHLKDLSEYEIYRWTIKPRNLEQPHLKMSVNTNYGSKVQKLELFTEYDLDTTRAMLYFREYLVAVKKKTVDEIEYSDTKILLIDKIWNEIRQNLPVGSQYDDDWRTLKPKYVILKMIEHQQNLLKKLGDASKNQVDLELHMQEGFKNKILDYKVSDADFEQFGDIDAQAIALEYDPKLVEVVSTLSFLNDFEKRSLLDGLTKDQNLLRAGWRNASNIAIAVNAFRDIFTSTADSIRMLKFVRHMQRAYELDGVVFNGSNFLKQIREIKDVFTQAGISSGISTSEWNAQMLWAVNARNLDNTSNIIISNISMTAGQVALSAAYAEEYMIDQFDQVSDILELGPKFFENKMKNMVSHVNVSKDVYDFIKVDKHGNAVLFKIGDKTLLDSTLKNTTEEVLDDNVNVVKLKGNVLCKASLVNDGKIDVRRMNTKQDSYIIIRCDSVEEAIEVSNSELFNDRIERFNLTKENMNVLYEYMIHEDNHHRIFDDDKFTFKTRLEGSNVGTKTLSQSEVDNMRTNSDKFFELLNEHVIASEKDFIKVRARNLYNSFKETLKYIGVRTPSQAMQSFMPLEVVMFVGSGSNLVYIPAAMTWFQGADYDIDKSFMMQLGLSGDTVDSGSNLSRKYEFSNLAKLPTPNNEVFFTNSGIVYKAGKIIVTSDPIIKTPSETKLFREQTYVMLSDIKNNKIPKYFDTLQTVLNIGNVYQSSKVGTNIVFVNDLDSITDSDIQKITKQFVNDLNTHNKTKLFNYWSRVMKNKVMYNAYELLLNPVNLILESMPIDFGEIGEFANNSTAGTRERKITGHNFMDKYIICEQAQLGKKEIGIVATAIKSYLVQTNVNNMKVVDAISSLKLAGNNLQRAEALNILATMIFERPVSSFNRGKDSSKSDHWTELTTALQEKMGDRVICLLANVDLSPIKELIKTTPIIWGIMKNDVNSKLHRFIVQNENGEYGFDIELLYKQLTLSNANEDVLMALSALLSAATDNMKELILSKIRASESTMGMFCTMLMQGYSLTQILNIFASDAFGLIDKFSKTNIFNGANTHGGDTKTIIKFLLGQGSLLDSTKDWALMSFLQNEEFLKEMKTKDGKSLYDKVSEILTNIQERKGNRKILLTELRDTLLFNKDNALVILNWLNSKIAYIQKQYDKNQYSDDDVEEDWNESDGIDAYDYEDDFDYWADEEDFGESNAKTRAIISSFNIKDFRIFRQFLDDCDYRNEFADAIATARPELELILNEVLPAAEENKWSGKILKINQGLPKSPEELIKFVTSLNAYINRTLNAKGYTTDMPFNLMTFLDSSYEQETFIKALDNIKSQQNVLRTVMDSPNFRSMFKVLKDSYDYQQYAYVTRKTNELLKEYAEQYLPAHDFNQTSITEEEYRAAQRVVQESIEANWLAQLGKTFLVNPGDFIYSRGVKGVGGRSIYVQESKGLTNADEFATFKYLMDNKVFPFLAEKLTELSEFKENEFLNNLKPYSQRLSRRLKATDFYKLDINMVNIDKSIMLKDQYEKILKDFDAIKDFKLDGLLRRSGEDWEIGDWTVGELIYIYDIIQNKGKVGKNSFAKLFENSQNNPLYLNRIKYLNALDSQSIKIENIQIKDLVFNLAWHSDIVAKINGVVTVGQAPTVVVEWNSNNSKISRVTVDKNDVYIKELPSDYTFFATPFGTQTSNIMFMTEVESKLSRYKLSDAAVLNAFYAELNEMFEGTDRFIKVISNEEIDERPEIFTNQNMIEDYKNSPAFYDNDVLYLNRSNMTTKQPLYALAEVMSWMMSNTDYGNEWRKMLHEQMPLWTGYEKHAKQVESMNIDPLTARHMIFGRFVYESVTQSLKNIPDFNKLRNTTVKEINDKMHKALESIFRVSGEFNPKNIGEYNLEDFIHLIGRFAKSKSSFSKLKLAGQMEAKLIALKKQLISEEKLSIIGDC